MRGIEFSSPGGDISAVWNEGWRIAQGIDPYVRVLSHADMTRDNYFPPYFPGFYLLVALSIKLGLGSFQAFLMPWRFLSTMLHVSISNVIFRRMQVSGQLVLGLVLALLWLLNRWSLFLVKDGPIDTVPLFLLVLALLSRAGSLQRALLFSLSLALKQTAIFLLPLFLIDQIRAKRGLWGSVALILFPLVLSLPFLLLNPEAFLKSLFIQFTRQHQGFPDSFTLILGLTNGWQARLPILAIVSLIYFLFAVQRVKLATAAFLVMFTFAALNPTFLTHYIVWPILLGLFAIMEAKAGVPEGTELMTKVARRSS